jgi:hypothetical protein
MKGSPEEADVEFTGTATAFVAAVAPCESTSMGRRELATTLGTLEPATTPGTLESATTPGTLEPATTPGTLEPVGGRLPWAVVYMPLGFGLTDVSV